MIKTIFFDIDNTLIDHSYAEQKALKELFENVLKRLLGCSYDEFRNSYVAINTQLWKLYNQSKVSRDDVRLGRFTKTLAHFGVIDFDVHAIWNTYASYYRDHWTQIDHAELILDYLSSKSYVLGLISNGFTDIQQEKLKKFKWENRFNPIVLSEQVGIQKPNKKIFEYALEKSGNNIDEVVYIGDSFETDYQGAIQAGWKFIYFSHENIKNEYKDVRHISSLKQLMEIF